MAATVYYNIGFCAIYYGFAPQATLGFLMSLIMDTAMEFCVEGVLTLLYIAAEQDKWYFLCLLFFSKGLFDFLHSWRKVRCMT